MHFNFALIDCIEKCRVHSEPSKSQTLGGGGVNLTIYPKSAHELSFLYALVFPYIFLLFDCFEWALIDCIVKCKVHSVLWQFPKGGGVNLTIYPKSANEL